MNMPFHIDRTSAVFWQSVRSLNLPVCDTYAREVRDQQSADIRQHDQSPRPAGPRRRRAAEARHRARALVAADRAGEGRMMRWTLARWLLESLFWLIGAAIVAGTLIMIGAR